MSKGKAIPEEFHVTLYVPAGMTAGESRSARRALSRRFRRRLERAAARGIARDRRLAPLTVRVEW